MKFPKSEPYQRSRHRAALHAWVVAATAVASIGMPATAAELDRRGTDGSAIYQGEQTAPHAAEQAARAWFESLRTGDRDAALSSMFMPRQAEHERAVIDEVGALADWLVHSNASVQHVAQRQAGHWALSAWRLDAPSDGLPEGGFIEPVTLYNPTADRLLSDGLSETAADWLIVPPGCNDDPALAPLYNADHDELIAWSQTLV